MMTLVSIEESYCKTWFDNYYKIIVHDVHGQVPKNIIRRHTFLSSDFPSFFF